MVDVIKWFASADELAEGIADQLTHTTVGALATRGIAHIVLTGGRMGTTCLEAVREHPLTRDIPWDGVHFWWSDERFVPSEDSERNDVAAVRALLSSLDLPAENVHRMPSSDSGLSLEEAAFHYWAELNQVLGDDLVFDICLLGVGEDGHVASLFPGRAEIELDDPGVIAITHSPKPPPERLTFTRELIACARQVWLLASGSSKSDAVWLIAADEPVPAARVHGSVRTLLLLDQDAAAGLPPAEADDWSEEEA